VPTIHQAVLAEEARRPLAAKRHHLRIIRSSSSPLPPPVLRKLESVFCVPVVESYGMTEAAHQICSNPLAPARSKAGSVGPAAGPEVAVMGDSERLLEPGETGEIVIRGPNVTAGYEDSPEANASAFTGPWLRTGDLGYRDHEGYFYITGRIKELINRGGEKIAPREVDEAILGHPDVAQAVTFAAPHPRLGEDVVAAVVLRPGSFVSEDELRRFALGRLAPHKVPSQVVIVRDIPKGPTGKSQRIGLHDVLGHRLRADYVPPESPFEEVVAAAWSEVLGVPRIGANDNFFTLGGDSLLAMRVISRLNLAFDVELPLETIFRTPTLAGQASEVEDHLIRTIEALPEPDDPRPSSLIDDERS
jgi:oxalate---CoA ligase